MNVKRLVALMLSVSIIMQITPVKAIDWQNDVNVTEDGSGNQIATPDWYEEGTAPKAQMMLGQTLGTENREKIYTWAKYSIIKKYVLETKEETINFYFDRDWRIDCNNDLTLFKDNYYSPGGSFGTINYADSLSKVNSIMQKGKFAFVCYGNNLMRDPIMIDSWNSATPSVVYGDFWIKGTTYSKKLADFPGDLISYSNSNDLNAFPQDGIKDGYWYKYKYVNEVEGKRESAWLHKYAQKTDSYIGYWRTYLEPLDKSVKEVNNYQEKRMIITNKLRGLKRA